MGPSLLASAITAHRTLPGTKSFLAKRKVLLKSCIKGAYNLLFFLQSLLFPSFLRNDRGSQYLGSPPQPCRLGRPRGMTVPLSRFPFNAFYWSNPTGKPVGQFGTQSKVGKGGERIWRGKKKFCSTPESLETPNTMCADASFFICCLFQTCYV